MRATAIAAAIALAACGTAAPADDAGTEADAPITGLSIDGPAFPHAGIEACFEIVRPPGDATITWGDTSEPEVVSGTTACHTYAYPGPLVMGARSGALEATKLLQVVLEPDARAPSRSSSIAYDAARDRVWAVEPDADHVVVIDARAGEREALVPVCDRPRSVAIAGDRALVACEGDGVVRVIDAESLAAGATIEVGAGSAPIGVIADPRGGGAWVTLQASGELASIDPAAASVRARIAIGPDPRAIAMTEDGTIAITRWRATLEAGQVYTVDGRDPAAPVAAGATLLPREEERDTDTDNMGVLGFLGALAPSPDGGRVIAAGLKANVVTGTFRTGELLTAQTTARAAFAEVSLAGPGEAGRDTFRHRFDDLDMVSAATFSPMGERLYVAMQGAEVVIVVDAFSFEVVGSIDAVGHAPDGIVISPDGSELWVHAPLARQVRAYDVRDLTSEPAPRVEIATVDVEPLDPEVLAGAILFHASRDPRMSRTRYLSCASCHMDGGDDGLTWDFTQRGEGLRNTIPLRGRGAGHGPIHWSGNFDEIQDFEHDIRGGQGGTGFLPDDLFHAGTRDTTLGDPKAGLSPELDALAAYVASLDRYGVSPMRRDGDAAWEAARARGEAIFASAGCDGCHAGARRTDSAFTSPGTPLLHDVGTLGPGSGMRLGGALSGLDTPTLRGLWASGPYLHDGSAPTLRAVLRDRNPDDRHGTTSGLSEAELDDLETYLLSLDDR